MYEQPYTNICLESIKRVSIFVIGEWDIIITGG